MVLFGNHAFATFVGLTNRSLVIVFSSCIMMIMLAERACSLCQPLLTQHRLVVIGIARAHPDRCNALQGNGQQNQPEDEQFEASIHVESLADGLLQNLQASSG